MASATPLSPRRRGEGEQISSMMGDSTTIGASQSSAKRKFPKHLVEIYDIEAMLGQGAFSTVFRCVHRATGQVRAVKKIDTWSLSPRDIAHEIALMKLLRHQNVVRCYDVFLEAQFVNIVVDIFTGGDLVDGLNAHRRARGRIPDAQLALLTRQMVAAIIHVHSLGIVHRDIKGENFLSDRPDIGDPECIVALADFGTAARLEVGATLSDKVGTPAFWAPEVFSGKYDFLVDVWALGVTVFLLLSATLPFEGEENICAPVGENEVPFTEPSFGMTKLCKDFVAACLTKDPKLRPPALEAQRHAWMKTPAPAGKSQSTAGSWFRERAGNVASCFGGICAGICRCGWDVCLEILAQPSEKNPSSPGRGARASLDDDESNEAAKIPVRPPGYVVP